MSRENKRIAAVDGVYPLSFRASLKASVVFVKGINGTVTGGTLAIEGLVPGSSTPEAIDGITPITMTAPTTQNIESGAGVEAIVVTLAGFTGTASEIEVAINTHEQTV